MIEYSYRRVYPDRPTLPIIPLEVHRRDGSSVSPPFMCLVDSGANVSLFHSDVAEALGLKLKKGLKQELGGVAGTITGYLHRVKCSIAGYPFYCRIVFSEEISTPCPIIGRLDFFESFNVTFDETDQRIYITPRIRPHSS